MTEVAHRCDPGHSGTAFQGVEQPLHFDQKLRVRAVSAEILKRELGTFQNLGGFFGKYRRYLRIELNGTRAARRQRRLPFSLRIDGKKRGQA